MKTVVIFGGAGFVGKNILRRLTKKNYRIIVPYQEPFNEAKLRVFGNVGQIIPIKFKDLNEDIIKNVVNECDVLINLKTIWQEKKYYSYKKNILEFNIQLVKMLNYIDKKRLFVFFSGLGVGENSSSKRSQYIVKVEKYIVQNLLNISIIRPSIIIGDSDNFMSKLLPVFKFSFLIPLFGGGKTKIQPVFVDDIAKALEIIIEKQIYSKNIYELVGPEIFTYKNFYNYIAKCLAIKRVFLSIPFGLAKIFVFLLEKSPINLITLEQLHLFKEDNIISNSNKNFSDLDMVPSDIKIIIKNLLKK